MVAILKRYFAMVLLLAAPGLWAAQTSDKPANPEGQQRRQGRVVGMRDGQGVVGTIEEIKSDSFTVKTMQGKTATVKVTGDTHFGKDRQPAKFADFKPGEMVMVGGESAGEDTWIARFVGSRSRDRAGMGAIRGEMGKQFIAGEVKAVDGTKLTIARPDGETQAIEVDENTSFRKGRESVTLPDIKVGDHVFGRGQLNSAGVFVPQELNAGAPGFGMGMGSGSGGGVGQKAPPPDAPKK